MNVIIDPVRGHFAVVDENNTSLAIGADLGNCLKFHIEGFHDLSLSSEDAIKLSTVLQWWAARKDDTK